MDISTDEITHQDRRWKSDVDRKLDRLVKTAESYDTFHENYAVLLRMLLERESTRTKWRNAIIEKTLAGLVWFCIVFIFVSSLEWIQRHLGFRT